MSTKKTQQISAAKRVWRLKRGTIKLTKATRLHKTALSLLASQRYCSNMHEIRSQSRRERAALTTRFRHLTWVDWLRQQAMAGDQEALRALRARDSTHGLQGDTLMASGHPVLKAAVGAYQDSVTKQGTIIYRVGASAVRDDGSKLQVPREVTDEGDCCSPPARDGQVRDPPSRERQRLLQGSRRPCGRTLDLRGALHRCHGGGSPRTLCPGVQPAVRSGPLTGSTPRISTRLATI
ncbi:MAG: hypothetical protein CV088_00705 [Nitrospira sp. LK70]|nr:hypothetical protein [Nitrospira sp. LK70]